MPFVRILTNAPIESDKRKETNSQLSALVAKALGKPESYVMTSIASGEEMSFSGTGEPCAYVELKSLGLESTAYPELSETLCEFIKTRIGVDPSRAYIEFAAPERCMFGWNGDTF